MAEPVLSATDMQLELDRLRAEARRAEVLDRIQQDVLERLTGGDPLPDVLEILVRLTEAVAGMRGSVLLARDGQLRHGAAPNLPAFYNQAIDGVAIGPTIGSCGAAAWLNEVVIVEDLASHPNWLPFLELAQQAGLGACWSHPIRGVGGEVLGTFALYYDAPRRPEAHELRLVERASHLAGIAIQQARHVAALEEQRAFVEQLLEELPGGIAYLDGDLVYRFANEAYAAVVGRCPHAIVGSGLDVVLPAAVDATVADAYRQVLATGEPFTLADHAFSTATGSSPDAAWDVSLSAKRDRAGRIVGVVAQHIDVTDRRRADQAMQAANEELTSQAEELAAQSEELSAANERLRGQARTIQGVMDSATAGILVAQAVYKDGAIADFRFIHANPQSERITGLPPGKIVGDTLLTLFPANIEAGLFQKYAHTCETGEPSEAETYYSDGRLNYWVAVSCVKVDDGVAITFMDITARKQTEETLSRLTTELEQQRRFAEALIHRLPAGVAYIDKDFVFRVVNPAMAGFYGVPLDQVLDRPVYDVLPGAEADIGHLYDQVRTTLEPLVVEAVPVAYMIGGVERITHWDATIVPYLGADGSFEGWLALALEVSDRQRLRAERDALTVQRIADLERANVHKEQFLSILSHELRTPINAIMGFASVLDDGLLGELTEPQHRYMNRILDGADRLLALITDLLDMSSIQAGRFSITPEEADVWDLADDVLGTLRALADQQRVALTISPPGAPATAWADPQRISQVLVNLVGNAIKFTPEGGQVAVAIAAGPDVVRVEVRDSGIGIAPEHHGRIFEAFTQVDMSSTRRSGGTGLGLAITKRLVEAHGGELGVDSAAGQGATFWFTLPRRAPE